MDYKYIYIYIYIYVYIYNDGIPLAKESTRLFSSYSHFIAAIGEIKVPCTVRVTDAMFATVLFLVVV